MEPNLKPIAHYMSRAPVSVELDVELASVVQLMERHQVRHLPVLDAGKIVGIVSERDLAIVEALVPQDWELFPVAEAMTTDPYTVAPGTPLREVAGVMVAQRYGCVLVAEPSGALVGPVLDRRCVAHPGRRVIDASRMNDMPPNAAKKTWVVLVRSGSTSVFERRNGDGALTRIRDFTAVPDETGSLADLVQWLDAARRARSFERFMLVAPANDAGQLLSGLSRPTRALLAAPQADVLHQLPEAAAS